jgi:hypothetical protein
MLIPCLAPASRSVGMTYTPPSSDDETDRPHNKSVVFAPLSPTSSRRLSRIHQHQQDNLSRSSTAPPESTVPPPLEDSDSDEPQPRPHRGRHQRRNSDPGYSDRLTRSTRDRRHRDVSPGGSDDTELLPDRFDDQGRPLGRSRGGGLGSGGGQNEMVERLVQDFTGVLDGKKTWKDMLKGFAAAAGGGGGQYDSDQGPSRGRRR